MIACHEENRKQHQKKRREIDRDRNVEKTKRRSCDEGREQIERVVLLLCLVSPFLVSGVCLEASNLLGLNFIEENENE